MRISKVIITLFAGLLISNFSYAVSIESKHHAKHGKAHKHHEQRHEKKSCHKHEQHKKQETKHEESKDEHLPKSSSLEHTEEVK